ncbi:MAG: hypothetical protein K6D97_08525, partial [Clostridia bacterium]|nr:hypothetical protein [Clostridia bacterium]
MGSGDDDKCELIDAILGSADKARSTSRSDGASSGTNSTRSGSSTNGANTNRQSGWQQRTQSGTNQRSSSGSTNSGRQTGGAETNQQSKTSSSSNNIDTIKFNNGTLKMVLNERKTQKMFEGLSGVYEYEFTDKRGNTIKIGSENTFEELSSKDMKLDIESWLLSQANISRASTFEVQDRSSQYGYVGKLEKKVYSGYSFKRDPFIIASLRDRQLKNVNELKFNAGKVKVVLNENGTQKTLQGESDVFEYEYTDPKGKTHTIYCGNTFKELSDPDIKYDVVSNLLTSNNVDNANSYDVQNRNSQYGFVGRLEKNSYGYYIRRIDEDIVRRQRIRKLRSVHELKFSVGKVKPVLNKNGTQKTLEGESGVYE